MSQRPLGCLFEVVETLVLTVVIFLVIQTFVAQPYRVEQESMQHTLEQGQYVLVDKLTPRFGPYARGDIVVFEPPEGGSVPFIKRVIGLPGDKVEIRDGAVFVNGTELVEPYIYDGDTTLPTGEESSYVVPPEQLFVMGDHRGNSTDSRVFGAIPVSNVIGRAWLRYWPIDTLSILRRPEYPGLGSTGALPPRPADRVAATGSAGRVTGRPLNAVRAA
ncbi:MAG TPA: signal peptidase I [Candidatus Limnocylindrales bacterium]|nr:signal peptidase I [Candidatus Limnocylindrales bacterium]